MIAARLPTLAEVIADHGGYLCSGMGDVHAPNGPLDILQAHSIAIGLPEITDDPAANRTWDIRRLNDMPVHPRLRTLWMPRVMAAYEGALDWPEERQRAVATSLIVATVRDLLSKVPEISRKERAECRAVSDVGIAQDLISKILTIPRDHRLSNRLHSILVSLGFAISSASVVEIAAAAARAAISIEIIADRVSYPDICRLWIAAAASAAT